MIPLKQMKGAISYIMMISKIVWIFELWQIPDDTTQSSFPPNRGEDQVVEARK